MAFRIDRASLSLSDLQPPRQRADGSWVYDAIVTRSGVFEYELEDGQKRREWRPPEEISKPESLETLHLAPVVGWRHTRKGEARGASVGTVGQDVEWVEDGGYARASVVVRADEALQAIQRGDIGEVSCGYEVDLEESAGATPDGQRYDAIQRGMPRADGTRGPIVYEHLAIVPAGRQGPQVALRTDSAPLPRSWRTDAAHQVTAGSPGGDAANQPPAATSRSKDIDMAGSGTRADCAPGEEPEKKMDGQMPPAAQPAAGGEADEKKALMVEIERLKAELAKAQAAQDAPRVTDSAAEAQRVDALVEARFARMELAARAAKLGVQVRADATTEQIKRAIVEHFEGPMPKERADSADPAYRASYIDGRFDVTIARVESATAAEVAARGGTPVRQDSTPALSESDLRRQMVERNRQRSIKGH